MDKNTPLTFGVFEDYFTKYMDNFRGYLDGRFDDLETRLKQHVSQEIDELALTTKMGFDHVDERFDAVDKRFHSVEELIDNLAYATKTGFDNMDEQFTDVKIEIRMLQGDMSDAKKYIQSSSIESSSNRVRLQNLEAHIA